MLLEQEHAVETLEVFAPIYVSITFDFHFKLNSAVCRKDNFQ